MGFVADIAALCRTSGVPHFAQNNWQSHNTQLLLAVCELAQIPHGAVRKTEAHSGLEQRIACSIKSHTCLVQYTQFINIVCIQTASLVLAIRIFVTHFSLEHGIRVCHHP